MSMLLCCVYLHRPISGSAVCLIFHYEERLLLVWWQAASPRRQGCILESCRLFVERVTQNLLMHRRLFHRGLLDGCCAAWETLAWIMSLRAVVHVRITLHDIGTICCVMCAMYTPNTYHSSLCSWVLCCMLLLDTMMYMHTTVQGPQLTKNIKHHHWQPQLSDS